MHDDVNIIILPLGFYLKIGGIQAKSEQESGCQNSRSSRWGEKINEFI